AGAQGTFQFALIAPPPFTSSTTSTQTSPDQLSTRIQTDTTTTTVVIQSVNLTFDSNEGETSTPTLPTASTSPALSSMFTFQTVGTYSVSVRGTVTTQVTAVTARTVTTTLRTHDASCNCYTTSSTVVDSTPNAVTQISTSSYQIS